MGDPENMSDGKLTWGHEQKEGGRAPLKSGKTRKQFFTGAPEGMQSADLV